MKISPKILWLGLLFLAMPIQAQETKAQDDTSLEDIIENLPEDTESDLEDTLFDDNESENNDEILDQNIENLYSLDFTAETTITFSNMLTGEAYMSVTYTTEIRQDVPVDPGVRETKAEANVTAEVVGQYAGNQFFSCRLEIEVDPTPVVISTRLRPVRSQDDEEPTFEAALQIRFDKSYGEDWYSFCQSTSGATLNTIAANAPEDYNLKILDLLKPTLTALLFENFVIEDGGSINLTMDGFEFEDFDTSEILTYAGEATLTLTPK